MNRREKFSDERFRDFIFNKSILDCISGMNHSPRGPEDLPSRPLDMTSGGGPGEGDGHPYYGGGGGMNDEGQGERWGNGPPPSRGYGGADFIPPRDWRR